MNLEEREEQGHRAINDFVAQSCVFILPGGGPPPAPEIGSGTILTTPNGRMVVLTAKHVALDARTRKYSLGYYKCLNVISDFVAAVIVNPGDVDVALLLVKQQLTASLGFIAAKTSNIPRAAFEIRPGDVLVVNGFPYQASYFRDKEAEQGFNVLTYWCHDGAPARDSHGRYRIPWRDFPGSEADVDLGSLSPGGMSGGPLWSFRRPPSNAVWSPGLIGSIVGVQSAWDTGDTLFIEPIDRWGGWFHEAIQQIDEHSD